MAMEVIWPGGCNSFGSSTERPRGSATCSSNGVSVSTLSPMDTTNQTSQRVTPPSGVPIIDPTQLDRRLYPRYVIDLPIELQLNGLSRRIPGLLRDVSRGGCLFSTSARITASPSMAAIELSVSRGTQVVACRAAGRVIREQPGNSFGVALLHANEEYLSFVDDLDAISPELRRGFLANVLHPSIVID